MGPESGYGWGRRLRDLREHEPRVCWSTAYRYPTTIGIVLFRYRPAGGRDLLLRPQGGGLEHPDQSFSVLSAGGSPRERPYQDPYRAPWRIRDGRDRGAEMDEALERSRTGQVPRVSEAQCRAELRQLRAGRLDRPRLRRRLSSRVELY